MQDPHVNLVRYKGKTGENVTYENCPPIYKDTDKYSLTLENDLLTFIFKEHYASVLEASAVIEPLLRSWEIDISLRLGLNDLKFKYLDSEVIDRNPPQPGSANILVSGIGSVSVCGYATLHVKRSNYPEPPQNFEVTPEVEIFWKRFEMYLEGRDQLQSMAYFCLSYMENLAGGQRRFIPAIYNIDRIVLDTLGDLTSERGDTQTARKGKDHNFIPLTNQEKHWIEECVKMIIRRVGEHSAIPHSLARITLSDLPVI
jgi:hypothetical protein